MDDFPISRDLLGKSASAYGYLRRAIVRGELRPGRRLTATDLAAAFRISVTPVREALQRLAAEGFLAWEASRGYFTKPITVDDQQDLHDMLALGLSAGLAGGEPTAVSVFEAAAAADPAMDAADDYSALVEALGAAIVAMTGNRVLQATMAIVIDRTHLVRRLDLAAPLRLSAAAARIRGLASAVLAADRARAQALLAEGLAARRGRLAALAPEADSLARRARYP